MNFLDGSLFPENQDPLIITAAPYGPEWMPSDFPEDIPVSMDEHVQKAVDCYNAGASVLHVHVREEDGHGSKRLSKFNVRSARKSLRPKDGPVLNLRRQLLDLPDEFGARRPDCAQNVCQGRLRDTEFLRKRRH